MKPLRKRHVAWLSWGKPIIEKESPPKWVRFSEHGSNLVTNFQTRIGGVLPCMSRIIFTSQTKLRRALKFSSRTGNWSILIHRWTFVVISAQLMANPRQLELIILWEMPFRLWPPHRFAWCVVVSPIAWVWLAFFVQSKPPAPSLRMPSFLLCSYHTATPKILYLRPELVG